MPANSAMVTVPLAISNTSMAKAVQRTPNSSRISSAKPLPVTTPMRATWSWTTISATVIGSMTHSRL